MEPAAWQYIRILVCVLRNRLNTAFLADVLDYSMVFLESFGALCSGLVAGNGPGEHHLADLALSSAASFWPSLDSCLLLRLRDML